MYIDSSIIAVHGHETYQNYNDSSIIAVLMIQPQLASNPKDLYNFFLVTY